MDINLHTTFLPQDDPEAALRFYRDTLGFELRNDVGYDGKRWLTMGSPGQPSVNIVLYPPGADPGITEDERKVITEMMAKGTFGSMLFSSKDLDATFEQLQAADVDIVQEPTEQPWGVRDFAVRDPAGNMLRVQAAS
ncbi:MULTISPECIES: VOC family protein [unclassified Nocardioides]|uniref:VOC family protein n=1 Tax=unclassified Nocardioides TaxID=2615069 RepID=UPI003617F6CC